MARCNPRHWFDPNSGQMEENCGEGMIKSTDAGKVTIIQDEILGSNGKGHQIKPQKIEIRTGLRKLSY